ncbi:unnamed protein product [Ranitomeya imitator]|uniref:TLC domain-containing protein n=1 Tax=Ranitomeya imitator TaxID=111125 RepID=A0ABN9MHN6_9NEOB|nr:unnamed protein product [Ranitomeya imitator]
MAFRRRKSYPIFSQEFVIHNHADIGFFFVLCVLIGLMFEVTAKTAFIFILPQYNSSLQSLDGEIVYYHYGAKDLVTILFYIIITIILHAIVQEYVLDKINRRLHLSKAVAEFLFHVARLFYFTDENNQKLFNAWAVVFVVTRLFTLTLSVLTIGFGLARAEIHTFNPDKGNFNTLLFRMIVLLLMCVSQTWMMWRFIHFQLRRWRECCKEQASKKRLPLPVMAKQQIKILKRDSGYHENGLIKAENGSTPRPKKIKIP